MIAFKWKHRIIENMIAVCYYCTMINLSLVIDQDYPRYRFHPLLYPPLLHSRLHHSRQIDTLFDRQDRHYSTINGQLSRIHSTWRAWYSCDGMCESTRDRWFLLLQSIPNKQDIPPRPLLPGLFEGEFWQHWQMLFCSYSIIQNNRDSLPGKNEIKHHELDWKNEVSA